MISSINNKIMKRINSNKIWNFILINNLSKFDFLNNSYVLFYFMKIKSNFISIKSTNNNSKYFINLITKQTKKKQKDINFLNKNLVNFKIYKLFIFQITSFRNSIIRNNYPLQFWQRRKTIAKNNSRIIKPTISQ